MDLSRIMDGKKFMWDGKEYGNEGEAQETAKKYEDDRFEVRVVRENNFFYVFTRRVAKEAVAEGEPPP